MEQGLQTPWHSNLQNSLNNESMQLKEGKRLMTKTYNSCLTMWYPILLAIKGVEGFCKK